MIGRQLGIRAVLLLILSVAVIVYATWLLSLLLGLPTDGCGGVYVSGGIVINQLPPDNQALRSGDVITKVNGQSVRHHLFTPQHWYKQLLETPVPTATYVIQRNGQEIVVSLPWEPPDPTWFLARGWVFVALGLVFVLSGAFVAWKRGNDLAARMMAFTLIVEGLNLANNLTLTTGVNTGLAASWFSLPVDILSLCLTVSGLFHCLALFPQIKWLGRRFPRLLYLIHLVNPLVALGGGLLFGGGTSLGIRSMMLSSAYAIAGIELVFSIGHIVHTYLTSRQPGVRNQIRWVMWGLVVGIIPWLFLYNMAYIITGQPLLPLHMVLLPLALIPVSLIFSIVRYGLMAIDWLVNRSLVYGMLTVVLITINLIAITLLTNLWTSLGGQSDQTAIVVFSTLVTVFTFSAIRRRLQRWIDRIFFKGRLNFENLLSEMAERLTTTLVFDNLVTLLTEYVPARLELTGAVLFTSEPDSQSLAAYPPTAVRLEPHHSIVSWFNQNGKPLIVSQFSSPSPEWMRALQPWAEASLEVCLPLRRAEKLIGIYALGRKASGDLFDDQEVSIVSLLGHQISSALENTRLYREIEEYNRTLETQVETRTRDLRVANKKLADTAWDLAEQRARLDAILQNIADGLVVTDSSGKVVLTNAVFEQIVGLDNKTLHGMPLQDAFSGQGLNEMVQHARAHVEQTVSDRVTAANGRVYKASACALAQGPVVIGVTTVLRDITHEVEVDRMKTDFISTVSHELRTPLTSVLGFAKLIQRSFETAIVPKVLPDDHKGQQAVERISRNLEIIAGESQRLTRLINDVLDIAKMEAGKIEWHMSDVHIGDIVDNAVSAVSGFIGEKHLQIELGVDAGLPQITADADRIAQVLTNLLSNAIKFSDQGQITIRTWRLAPGDDIPPVGARSPDLPTGLPYPVPMLAISVSDTGIGIKEADLPAVFERFKQVGDLLTGRPRGTGLGLSICREIVEYHGGHIWVESTPGQGSRFLFTLPFERPPEAAMPQPADRLSLDRQVAAPGEPPAHEVQDLGPLAHLHVNRVEEVRQRISESLPQGLTQERTILVVDDEPSIRLLLNQELTDAGYRVIEAAEGLAAVEIARVQQPDLILLDVMMPGLSGFDVTTVLKADEHTRHIPILILSIIEDRERGFRLGADDYLTKPVHTERLLEAISTLLNASAEQRHALIVHQDESVVEAITHVLREHGFDVTAAYDPRGAIEKAQEVKPDLVILNAMISQLDDYQFFKALNYTNLRNQMDILVLAGGEAGPSQYG